MIVRGVLYDYLNREATKATVPEGVWRVEDYVFSGRPGLCVTLPSSVCNVGLNAFKGCAAVKGGRNDMEDSNVYHALGGDKGVKEFLEGRLLLDGAIKKWLIAYIKRKKKDFAAAYIDGNDVDAMRSFLALWKKAPLANVDSYIAQASAAGRTELAAMLIDYKNKTWPPEVVEQIEQNDIDKAFGLKERTLADWRKIFKIVMNGKETAITGYLAEGTVVELPYQVGDRVVTEVGKDAFSKREDITEIVILEGVTKIGPHAFKGCTGLKKLTIKGVIQQIERGAFEGCDALQDEQSMLIVNGILGRFFDKTAREVVLPEDISAIAGEAFFGMPGAGERSHPGKRKVDRCGGIFQVQKAGKSDCHGK